MQPKEGAVIGLPGRELLTFEKPGAGSGLSLSTRSVVVGRWVWNIKPPVNLCMNFF